MLDMNKLPDSGCILAYSREKILFGAYVKENNCVKLNSGEVFDEKGFYEIHCFDGSREYRLFTSHGEMHEAVLSEQDEAERETFDTFTYREEQFLQEKYSRLLGYDSARLVVINRFAYTEDDDMYLAGYRLGGIIHD